MVSSNRPWQGHQALAIEKKNFLSLLFSTGFEVLQRLIPNLFEIAASIMDVDSKWLSTVKI
jgi:hypothetical protein